MLYHEKSEMTLIKLFTMIILFDSGGKKVERVIWYFADPSQTLIFKKKCKVYGESQ